MNIDVGEKGYEKRISGTYLYSGSDIQHRCDLHRFWTDWELFSEIWNEICV